MHQLMMYLIKNVNPLNRYIKLKEWDHYVNRITNIFKSKNPNGAKMRINILINNINHLTH